MSPNLSESTPLDLDRKPPAWFGGSWILYKRQPSPPAAWPGWPPWPRPWARWCALQMLLRCSRWTSSLNPGRRKPGLAWKRVGGNQNIFGPRSDHALSCLVSQPVTHSLTHCEYVLHQVCQSCDMDLSKLLQWSTELNDLWSKMICRPKVIVWSGNTFIERMKLLPGGDFKLVIVGKGCLWPTSQDQ